YAEPFGARRPREQQRERAVAGDEADGCHSTVVGEITVYWGSGKDRRISPQRAQRPRRNGVSSVASGPSVVKKDGYRHTPRADVSMNAANRSISTIPGSSARMRASASVVRRPDWNMM